MNPSVGCRENRKLRSKREDGLSEHQLKNDVLSDNILLIIFCACPYNNRHSSYVSADGV